MEQKFKANVIANESFGVLGINRYQINHSEILTLFDFHLFHSKTNRQKFWFESFLLGSEV